MHKIIQIARKRKKTSQKISTSYNDESFSKTENRSMDRKSEIIIFV